MCQSGVLSLCAGPTALVSGGHDSALRVWDQTTLAPLRVIDLASAVGAAMGGIVGLDLQQVQYPLFVGMLVLHEHAFV